MNAVNGTANVEIIKQHAKVLEQKMAVANSVHRSWYVGQKWDYIKMNTAWDGMDTKLLSYCAQIHTGTPLF